METRFASAKPLPLTSLLTKTQMMIAEAQVMAMVEAEEGNHPRRRRMCQPGRITPIKRQPTHSLARTAPSSKKDS
jgi:hypothetical protein